MDLTPARSWQPPDDWGRLVVIDSHAEGEPFRVVVDGLPHIPGDTMLERRAYGIEHLDDLRRALMWEPRGHSDMYDGWIGDPIRPDSHLSVLFLHNEGLSTMCGHGVIALTKCDLPEPDWLELVEQEVRALVAGCFLANAPIVRTSAHTGQGLDELRAALASAAEQAATAERRTASGPFRLPIDRSFIVQMSSSPEQIRNELCTECFALIKSGTANLTRRLWSKSLQPVLSPSTAESAVSS